MKTYTYAMTGKTGKTLHFPPFPCFRNAGWEAGKTGKTSLEFSPFPSPRCRDVLRGAK